MKLFFIPNSISIIFFYKILIFFAQAIFETSQNKQSKAVLTATACYPGNNATDENSLENIFCLNSLTKHYFN